MFKIVKPGLKATIQDMGRYGYYHLGVPPSGAADKFSFQLGNLLLGNPVDVAALEITLLGPEIEVRKNTVINITGAPIVVFINSREVPMWENIEVKKGDIISFEYKKNSGGVFTFICVSGGISHPKVLGSRSTYLLGDFDGYLSKKLEAGDEIMLSETLPGAFKLVGRSLKESDIPSFPNDIDVHAVMGLTSSRITDTGIRNFLTNEWKVDIESNRVAYRLKGPTIDYADYNPPFGSGGSYANVVDMAYPIGAILLPNPEEVIVLLNDGTGGGGFVSMGTVISPDLDLLAQARPFSTLRFHAVTVEQALHRRLERKKKLKDIQENL